MIERTFNQCIKAFPKSSVFVATDDERIANHCTERGMQVIMTSQDCLTGTDRIAEAAEHIGSDYYINVQGDEPLINPEDIIKLAEATKNYPGEILNGYCEIDDPELFYRSTIPKVVFRPDKRLLYMSRASIPTNKEYGFQKAWRQVCIYGFPATALQKFRRQQRKTKLEQIEDIEILRFLEIGYDVRMIEMTKDSIAVDIPEDVEKVLKTLGISNEKY